MFTFLVGEINGFRTRLSARAQFALGNRKKAGREREKYIKCRLQVAIGEFICSQKVC